MKKFYGQHFLHDKNIARKIASSLSLINKVYDNLIEIGPGNGSLTDFIYQLYYDRLWLIEIDKDLIPHLNEKFPLLIKKIIHDDFLNIDIKSIVPDQVGIIGNFPYNISSQIIFKIIENQQIIPEMVGMFQKEVAERINAKPNSKIYGKISVITQAYYDTEILFNVPRTVFYPQPEVESAVIRLIRKSDNKLNFPSEKFNKVVKAAFLQRRKTLKNALSSGGFNCDVIDTNLLSKRAENLSVSDFIELTLKLN